MRLALLSLVALTVAAGLCEAQGSFSAAASPGAACSAILPDGRSLVSGGRSGTEALSSAAYFERGGGTTPTSPMLEARSGHLCVALQDGSVLVAGGETGKTGPTNSAEVFHPETNAWTAAAAMLSPRLGAAAILLKSGKVLIAGGEVSGKPSNALETYDPTTGRFEEVRGMLSAPRARHALAILEDGRVVIAGGMDAGRALDSIDLYDPAEGTVTFAGRMSAARANFTATALPGNKVLFAGGTDGHNELDSAETYDAATAVSTLAQPMSIPRQGHIAVRIAATGEVLITGRTQDDSGFGPAESFDPASGAFRPLQEAAPGEAPSTELTVGILNPNGTVRAQKTYRLSKTAQ